MLGLVWHDDFPRSRCEERFCLHCVPLAAAMGQIEGFAGPLRRACARHLPRARGGKQSTSDEDRTLHDRLVDEGAAFAILDLDDPDVGIEADLPGEVFRAAGLVGRVA